MDYETNWNGGEQYGNDGYGEQFPQGGYAPPPPGRAAGNEDFGPGTQEVRIRAPQANVSPEALAQTRQLLGLGAPPSAAARTAQARQAVQQAPISKSGWLLPAAIAGALGLGWWYWSSSKD